MYLRFCRMMLIAAMFILVIYFTGIHYLEAENARCFVISYTRVKKLGAGQLYANNAMLLHIEYIEFYCRIN